MNLPTMAKKSNHKRKPYLKDEKFLKEFGERIREIRKKKNMTQETLANTINVDVSQISRLERGILNVSISLVKKISFALEISLSELFDFKYN